MIKVFNASPTVNLHVIVWAPSQMSHKVSNADDIDIDIDRATGQSRQGSPSVLGTLKCKGKQDNVITIMRLETLPSLARC